MKILHVISGINPASGGPTRSVKGLCRALSQKGIEIALLVLHGDDIFENPCGVKTFYGCVTDIKRYDIVHFHGLWDPLLHAVAKVCRRESKKYVISPRGMLDPWALSVKKWKKKIALWLYQRRDLNSATAFHVTAHSELEHVRALGFNQPCIVAPNAVDLPSKMPERSVGEDVKTAIFLSRLHPGKGLLTLAEAWAQIRPQEWKMKVVGPDSYGHKKEVLEALARLGILSDWEFVDVLDDVRKWEAYRSADLLIHPSVSENFGITIAEGLAAELPVICTKGTPWGIVEERKCGWWIDIGVEPLARVLHEAMAFPDEELREMGKRGRKLIEEKYTWNAVVKEMVKGYERVVSSC